MLKKQNHHKKTFYIQWHFTERCNLRCVHCYQDSYRALEQGKEELLYIAKHFDFVLEKWNRKGRISLTGGEPFINKQYLFTLLNFFNNSPSFYWIGILTNGTLITKDDVVRLKNYDKLSEIQVSLDGATEYVHDLIRGKGTFRKAIEVIRLLKQEGLPTTIMFTLMRWNLMDIDEVINLALKLGVNAITMERITPTDEFSKTKLALSKEEVYLAYKRVYELKKKLKSEKMSLKIRTSRPLWRLLDKNIGGFCPVGISSIAILHDGTVLPCRRLPIPIGNIYTDGLFKIWYTSDLLWKMRNRENLKGKCRNCNLVPYCSGCRAEAFSYYGDFLEEDPHCFKDLYYEDE